MKASFAANGMRPDYIIRPAVAAGAQCLAALAIQVWLHTYATDGIRSSIASYVLSEFTAEKFSNMLHAPGSLLLVAESNQNLIGYALLRFDATGPAETHANVELSTLYVQEHFARRGLGTALMVECLRWVDGYGGADRIWLTANSRNGAALAFYRKLDFEHTVSRCSNLAENSTRTMSSFPHANRLQSHQPDHIHLSDEGVNLSEDRSILGY